MVNKFVSIYKEVLKTQGLKPHHVFIAVSKLIAESGSINDLQSLCEYHEKIESKNWEELNNESTTRTISKSAV